MNCGAAVVSTLLTLKHFTDDPLPPYSKRKDKEKEKKEEEKAIMFAYNFFLRSLLFPSPLSPALGSSQFDKPNFQNQKTPYPILVLSSKETMPPVILQEVKNPLLRILFITLISSSFPPTPGESTTKFMLQGYDMYGNLFAFFAFLKFLFLPPLVAFSPPRKRKKIAEDNRAMQSKEKKNLKSEEAQGKSGKRN